ncbi:MAG: septum formation initiator family protein [Candidatus Omnitrophica bacterium]|nr:septum formation initiator family protein [Candidatus Omnitrophota bacterium]
MRVKLFNVDSFKLWRLIIGFVILLIGVGIVYLPSYLRLRRLRKENQRVIEKIAHLKKEIKTLETDVEKLQNESSLWEKLVREKLGVAKKDEIVIDIKD